MSGEAGGWRTWCRRAGVAGRRAAIGCALVAVPVTGCAGPNKEANGPRQRVTAETLPGLEGRRCSFVRSLDRPVAFGDLTRPGTRGNLGLWGARMEPGDSAVVSIRYDEGGRLSWVRGIQASTTAGEVATLERILRVGVLEHGPSDWGVRIFLDAGELMDVRPSVACPAERRSGSSQVSLAMPASTRAYAALRSIRGRRFPVRVALDTDGRIMAVDLLRSSGAVTVDQFILDQVLSFSYDPKLHDGMGVATTVIETVHIPDRP